MHALHPDTGLRDDEAGCTPRWSQADAGAGPRSFVYPAQARPLDRRQVTPRPARPLTAAGEPPTTGAATAPGLTPEQWLAQWCCLEEEK